MVRVQTIEHGAVVCKHIDEKLHRFLEHRLAQFVGKGAEPLAIDGVQFFESPEIEPVAAELNRQRPHLGVLAHSRGLRDEHIWPMQITGRGMVE